MNIFEIKNLHFKYSNAEVLKGISFSVQRGEVLIILGPNASGKTTLLKNLAGLLSPTQGSLILDGKEIAHYRRQDLAKIISFVPQEEEIFLPFTVEQIVLMGRAPYTGMMGFEKKQDADIVKKVLEETNLMSLRDSSIQELSGGEKQRVWLARALAQESSILLLDEPTSHLDIHYQIEILELLTHLRKSRNLTIVMTLHDINLASLFATRLILLKEGTLHSIGEAAEVIHIQNIQQVFGATVSVIQQKEKGPLYCLPQRK